MNIVSRRKFLFQSAAVVGGGVLASCKGGDHAAPTTETTPPVSAPATSTFEVPVADAPVISQPGPIARPVLSSISELTGGWTFRPVSTAQGDTTQAPASAEYSKLDPATVPGTVLTSMIDNGVYPDPLYRHIVTDLIKDNLKDTNYWFCTDIDIPVLAEGQRFWIRFDGINYLADIWVNGQNAGRIEGAFKHGYFDVTDIVKGAEPKASLAVLIYKLDYSEGPSLPDYESGVTRGGRNGGPTGITLRNGPTFFCTAGWDWLPTIPDRCLGIWQPVYGLTTGAVRIADVRVDTTLSDDLSSAQLAIDVTLTNSAGSDATGLIVGTIGDTEFQYEVQLPVAGTTSTVTLTTADIPQLAIAKPQLWWPNGYGDPYLYPLSIRLDIGSTTSDLRQLTFGVRKISYSRKRGSNTDLAITVNNLPILIMGGNWGMDEALKRIPRQRLFNQVRLHRDANLNLIRNWNGQSTSRDFFDACDQYGILVWQEFFFSTEGNGASSAATYNVPRYLDNIRDVIINYRNHPSILLWCGGNEGTPTNQAIVDGLDKLVTELDPKRECLTSSAGDTTGTYQRPPIGGYSSGGPYHWVNPQTHFSKVAESTSIPFHNEIGSYSVPTLEFVQSMLPEASFECPDDYWADRDINGNGGNPGNITAATAKRYGKLASLADFVRKAQLMNYECIRAIYESHAANFGPISTAMPSPSTGVIMWMTNPAQPSFVWQMYSHDLEQHSSFFAVQHGSRRVNAIMDSNTRNVTVVNHSSASVSGSLEVSIFNLDGSLSSRTVPTVPALSPASSMKIVDISAKIAAATSAIAFVSLRLVDAAANVLAENIYWYQTNGNDTDYTTLDTAPAASVTISAQSQDNKDRTTITVIVANVGNPVALMVHLQVFDQATGDRILPAYFSDNYLNILPQAQKAITIDIPYKDGKPAGNPAIRVDGWKLDRKTSSLSLIGVPVVFNENALSIAAVGAGFAACG